MQDENIERPGFPREEEQVLNTSGTPENLQQVKKTSSSLQMVINVILLIGLAVLYILFFTSKKTSEPTVPMAFQKSGSSQMKVVFVNIDTLNSRYEYVKVMKTELEGTGKKMQAEILAEQNAFEKEAADFQKQVAANAIAEDKAKIIYESLMQKQQMLVDKKDKYTQQVADKELDMNIALIDTVTNFLKRYNKKYHYDYILAHKAAGELLLANDTLDITKEVLKSLNEEYNARKK